MNIAYLAYTASRMCKDNIVPIECDGILYRIIIPWESTEVLMSVLYILLFSIVVFFVVKVTDDLNGHRISERAFVRNLAIFIVGINSVLWTSVFFWYIGLPFSMLANMLLLKIVKNYEEVYRKVKTLSIDELRDRGFFGLDFWRYKQKRDNFLSLEIHERNNLLDDWVGINVDFSVNAERLMIFITPILCVIGFFFFGKGYILF